MALQVWLPLDGDLRNLGLSDLKFSVLGNHTTVDNDGKIGKCYKNSTYGQGGIISNKTITLPVTLSWFCWINFSSLGTSSELNGVVSNHMPTSTPANMGITIKYLTSTTGKLSCSTGNGTNRTYKTYTGNTTLTAEVWYHIGFTYNGSKIKFYVNGVLDGETSYANQSQIAAKIGIFAWNMNSSSPYGYAVPGKLNDVRIYDHCLSEDEIHELSLGKVGHWKLNDYEISRSGLTSVTWNQLINPSRLTTVTTGGVTCTADKSNGTITCTGTSNGYSVLNIGLGTNALTNGHKYLMISNPNKTWGGEPSSSGGSFDFSLNNGSYYRDTGNGCVFVANSSNHNFYFRFGKNYVTNGLVFYPMLFDLTLIFGSGNEPTAAQFEEMFPLHYYSYDAGTAKDLRLPIPDISGYHNNLTANGNLTLSTDTKRYNKSTYIPNGVTDYLVSPTIHIPGDAITTNIWIKSSNTSATGSYHMPFESESSGYMEMSISSGVALRGGLYINGTRYVQNVSGNVLDGKWHMITITYDGATIKRYVDGVLGNSTSVSGTLNATAQKYYFGKYGTNNSYASKEMYISDARLYSTALSADDVLKLYKLGNV